MATSEARRIQLSPRSKVHVWTGGARTACSRPVPPTKWQVVPGPVTCVPCLEADMTVKLLGSIYRMEAKG